MPAATAIDIRPGQQADIPDLVNLSERTLRACVYSVLTRRLLALLLVDVYAQGRGIGTLLLRHSEQLVFRSHTEIWLESFVANSRANAFYARRGWTRGGRHLDAKSGMDVWKFSKQKT